MGQSNQLTPERLKQLAMEIPITNPIMSHRVVGDRVELHLLGGMVVTASLTSLDDLMQMDRDRLYELAQKYNVRGRSKMNVDQLRAAVAEAIAEEARKGS